MHAARLCTKSWLDVLVGHLYCQSCTDFQALMPRQGDGQTAGYDPVPVCAFCIENLTSKSAISPSESTPHQGTPV